MKYNKIHFTIDQQIEKIKTDGFKVSDEIRLKEILENLNYYKLKGYISSTKKEYGDSFLEEKIDIFEVIDTYNFDERLRTFLFEILEKIEVSLKSKIANILSNDIGAFGYLDLNNFKVNIGNKYFSHSQFLTNLENYQNRSKEDFMIHYRKKYTEEKYTPLWMMVELLPFGDLSRFYEAYKKNKKISKQYDLSPDILASWLHRLSFIRNVCAHNSRIWNIVYINKSKLKQSWKYHYWQKLEGTLFFMDYMIKRIKPEYDFKPLYTLIDDFIKKYPKKAIPMGIITPDKLKYLIETPKI